MKCKKIFFQKFYTLGPNRQSYTQCSTVSLQQRVEDTRRSGGGNTRAVKSRSTDEYLRSNRGENLRRYFSKKRKNLRRCCMVRSLGRRGQESQDSCKNRAEDLDLQTKLFFIIRKRKKGLKNIGIGRYSYIRKSITREQRRLHGRNHRVRLLVSCSSPTVFVFHVPPVLASSSSLPNSIFLSQHSSSNLQL